MLNNTVAGPMLPRNADKYPNMNDARVINDQDLFLAGGRSPKLALTLPHSRRRPNLL